MTRRRSISAVIVCVTGDARRQTLVEAAVFILRTGTGGGRFDVAHFVDD